MSAFLHSSAPESGEKHFLKCFFTSTLKSRERLMRLQLLKEKIFPCSKNCGINTPQAKMAEVKRSILFEVIRCETLSNTSSKLGTWTMCWQAMRWRESAEQEGRESKGGELHCWPLPGSSIQNMLAASSQLLALRQAMRGRGSPLWLRTSSLHESDITYQLRLKVRFEFCPPPATTQSCLKLHSSTADRELESVRCTLLILRGLLISR